MNPNDNTEISAPTLIALRQKADALQIITERLNVKQMGPADHIRTKHEVKAFIESVGDLKEAESIIARACARRAFQEAHETTLKVTEKQGPGIKQ
jgi:hypothetical protein